MDRSFLSDEKVIKASRDFVCIRTATYEDKREAVFLKSTFLGRSGKLRNFGYCVLSPDATRKLRRSDRGPNFFYADSNEMAKDLRRIAEQYSGQSTAKKPSSVVPQVKSVRLGVNVASCDGLPIIVAVGKNQEEVDRLKQKLSEVIWDEELAGKFVYASTSNLDDLRIVAGAESKTGILVVDPDTYGTTGRLISAIAPDVSTAELKKLLSEAARTFTRKSKSHRSHVRYGRRNGKRWETEVPVPDRSTNRRSSTRYRE